MTELTPLPQASAGDPVLTPRGRILRAADIEVWHEGAALMDAARAHAARIVAAAEEERGRLVEAGRRDGEAAAAEAVTRRLADATRRIDEVMAGCETWLAELVADIVDRILGEGDHRALTVKAAANALREFRHARRLLLRVPSSSVAWIEEGLEAGLEPAVRRLLVIQPDPVMEEGRCVVSCEFGTVEAGIADQITALRAGLRATGGEGGR